MQPKLENSELSSKNPSFYKKKFPSLSHKASESMPKEKLMDLGYTPH